jgi:hypothetical protein
MQSFERELHPLRPILGDPATDVLIARERREVFSIRPELRLIAWGGAMLLATAAGIVLKNNLERIGPLALALSMGLAAAVCYAWTWWHRERAGLVDEYVLLLGALLVSADAAFIESQFRLFGTAWHRHFLILAVLHGVAAYLYRSRTVLSLALSAVAAWLGVRGLEGAIDGLFGRDGYDWALRAMSAAAVVLIWRQLNRREEFAVVFEHFAAVLLLAAGFSIMIEDEGTLVGSFITIAIAGLVVWWGFRTHRVSFVLYAFVAAVIAFDVLVVELLDESAAIFFVMVVTNIVAIGALFWLYGRFREARS